MKNLRAMQLDIFSLAPLFIFCFRSILYPPTLILTNGKVVGRPHTLYYPAPVLIKDILLEHTSKLLECFSSYANVNTA